MRLREKTNLSDLIVGRIQLIKVLQLPNLINGCELVARYVQLANELKVLDVALPLLLTRIDIHKLLYLGILLGDGQLRECKR